MESKYGRLIARLFVNSALTSVYIPHSTPHSSTQDKKTIDKLLEFDRDAAQDAPVRLLDGRRRRTITSLRRLTGERPDQDLRSDRRETRRRVQGVREDPGPQGGSLRSVLRPGPEIQRAVPVR